MEKLFCNKCGKLVDYKIIEKAEIVNVRQENIEINSRIAVCLNCDSKLFHPKLEDENLEQVYREYAKRKGLLYKEDITRIRNKYGVSQRLFSQILGIGKATIERYETGALPSKVHSDLIKRADDPVFFKSLLQERHNEIAETDYQRLLSKIDELINTLSTENKREIQLLEQLLLLKHPNIDFEKLSGVVAEIFIQLKKQHNYTYIYKTVFLKLLWLIEKEAKKILGRQIINLRFKKYIYGPIPLGTDKDGVLFSYLSEQGKIQIRTEFVEHYLTEGHKIFSKDETASRYLDENEIEIIKNIVKKYGKECAKTLSEISHNHEEYINSEFDEVIDL